MNNETHDQPDSGFSPHDQSPVSTEALRFAAVASARIVEAKAQALRALEGELESARREHRLLTELLALRGETPTSTEVNDADDAATASVDREEVGDDPVSDAAVAYLTEVGQPTHIGEIFTALINRSVEIPGAGDQANVILRLRGDSRITRTSRGVYGLRAWNLPEYAPRPRKKSTRAKKVGR